MTSGPLPSPSPEQETFTELPPTATFLVPVNGSPREPFPAEVESSLTYSS